MISTPDPFSVRSRREVLGSLTALTVVGAVGALDVVAAPAADAAGSDPVLHLLRRTTYGPTPQLVGTVRRMGRAEWLERQLRPATVADRRMDRLRRRWVTLDYSPGQVRTKVGAFTWEVMYDLCEAHLARAAWSERQLFEVMVDFWSNHLNIPSPSSDVWATRHLFDRDVVRRHALGRFDDMLVASARHPAMLTYLNNADSTKKAPNENYARELLELHTVGASAGYSETMVRSAAQLLTGLSIDWDSQRYVYDSRAHATGRVKVLGFSHANNSAYGEKSALAMVRYLAHHPATARRIATKLCLRFVSDDPPPALVRRLASVYRARDTDIRPVLRALFRSREFADSAGAKVRRPFEDLVATIRAVQVHPPMSPDAVRHLMWLSHTVGQPPLGWSRPDGYPDTASAWQSAGSTLARWNSHLAIAQAWWPESFRQPELAALLRPRDPRTYGGLVDAVAAGLAMPKPRPEVRAAVSQFLGYSSVDRLSPTAEAMTWRLPAVFALVLDSPEFARR